MIKAVTVDFNTKIFCNDTDFAESNRGFALCGASSFFQMVVNTDRNEWNVKPVIESDRRVIAYRVANVPVYDVYDSNDPRDDYFLFDKGNLMPDPLIPCEKGGFWLTVGVNNVFLLEVLPDFAEKGESEITIKLIDREGKLLAQTSYTLVTAGVQPLAPSFTLTNWFHFDCLSERYRTPFLSDDYMEILSAYIDEYVAQGNDVILTPLFTLCLDTDINEERPTAQLVRVKKDQDRYSFDFTDFEKFVVFMTQKGIRLFELGHLFTQWGAEHCPKVVAEEKGKTVKLFGWQISAFGEEYRGFLAQFLPALLAEIDRLGIRDRVLFHISDEPSESNAENYRRHKEFLSPYLRDFKVMDAVSDPAFCDYMDLPVIAVDHYEKFRDFTGEKWAYYCCGQVTKYVPNLMIAMPALRTRLVGVLLYVEGATGLLHWGFNYWYSFLSKDKIDPFLCNDSKGRFPAGDAFLVYPGEDKKPIVSIRAKYLVAAKADYRLLKEAEKRLGRDNVMEILSRYGYHSFTDYPHSEQVFAEMIEQIFVLLANS